MQNENESTNYKVPHIYIFYPHNAANEYSLVMIKSKKEKERLDEWYYDIHTSNNDLHRITREEMKKLNARERERAKYDRSHAGLCDIDPHTFEEFAYWKGIV